MPTLLHRHQSCSWLYNIFEFLTFPDITNNIDAVIVHPQKSHCRSRLNIVAAFKGQRYELFMKRQRNCGKISFVGSWFNVVYNSWERVKLKIVDTLKRPHIHPSWLETQVFKGVSGREVWRFDLPSTSRPSSLHWHGRLTGPWREVFWADLPSLKRPVHRCFRRFQLKNGRSTRNNSKKRKMVTVTAVTISPQRIEKRTNKNVMCCLLDNYKVVYLFL